jgi:hypothetical protein
MKCVIILQQLVLNSSRRLSLFHGETFIIHGITPETLAPAHAPVARGAFSATWQSPIKRDASLEELYPSTRRLLTCPGCRPSRPNRLAARTGCRGRRYAPRNDIFVYSLPASKFNTPDRDSSALRNSGSYTDDRLVSALGDAYSVDSSHLYRYTRHESRHWRGHSQ